MKRTYEVINYDVWGNEVDGYEVNDAHTTGIELEFDDDASDAEIVIALKTADFLAGSVKSSQVTIDGEPEHSLYLTETETSRPLCELRAKKEN